MIGTPHQLFAYETRYRDSAPVSVRMRAPDGHSYEFTPQQRGVQYFVTDIAQYEGAPLRHAVVEKQDAPSVLETIFGAGTKERIFELQAQRRLIDCRHVDA